ncbi:flavodoxin-like protein [Pseudoduganella flava]|nr:flavodoxin [Pseudoduganella flava]TWI46802.1 flavodoxin-like protein [Pseudoduganella flava]
MNPYLIVYFSRSGYTRRVAEAIAAGCAADIEELRPLRDYQGIGGYLRAALDTLRLRTPELQPLTHDPSAYQLVLVGTPVWAGHVPAPVYSFLSHHGAQCRRLAAFCTMGGSGGDKVLDKIAELAGKPLAGRLVLTDRDIEAGKLQSQAPAYTRELSEHVALAPLP